MRKRKKHNTKKEAQKLHFAKRSIQRIGRAISQKDLISAIQNQELELIEKQSNRVSLFKFEFENESYKVVYDKNRQQVVTILYSSEELCKKIGKK